MHDVCDYVCVTAAAVQKQKQCWLLLRSPLSTLPQPLAIRSQRRRNAGDWRATPARSRGRCPRPSVRPLYGSAATGGWRQRMWAA